MEEDRLKREGQSIFFMIRDIMPEMNRLVSIMQTLNQRLTNSAMKNITTDSQTEPPDYPKSGEVVNVENDLVPIDFGDARKSAEMVFAILEKALQQGSISDIDLGNLNFPMSAVALVTVGEGKDKIYLPRLNAKADLNQATAEMITRQVLQLDVPTIELGTPGHMQSFDTAKLEGEYETTYKYYVKSPQVDVARLTMGAEALKMGVDRETVYTDIMQYEDPKGMIQKFRYQEAEELSPLVKINRTIQSLLQMAEDDENEEAARDAQLMALELGVTIDQIKAGVMQPPKPSQAGQGGQPLMPLLGKGGNVGKVTPVASVSQPEGI
jgi:hypothetical protein